MGAPLIILVAIAAFNLGMATTLILQIFRKD